MAIVSSLCRLFFISYLLMIWGVFAAVVVDHNTGNVRLISPSGEVHTTSSVVVEGQDLIPGIQDAHTSAEFLPGLYTPSPRLDTHIIQNIRTNGALHSEAFTIPNAGDFLAIANSRDGSTSGIYKWDPVNEFYYSYFPLPSVVGGIMSWKYFQFATVAGTDYCVAYANPFGKSEVLKWNTQTSNFSRIYTPAFNFDTGLNYFEYMKLSDWDFFSLGNSDNILCASIADEANSHCFKTTASHRQQFELFQTLPTYGALDVEHFTIGTDHYIAFSNSYDNAGQGRINVGIWYVQSLSTWQNILNITADAPIDSCGFTINGTTYLAVAENGDGFTATYSSIYKWVPGQMFVLLQKLRTTGAYDFSYFSFDNEHYLFLSQQSSQADGYKVHSKLFKFNGRVFGEVTRVSTSGASHFRVITPSTSSGVTYGFVSNSADNISPVVDSYLYRIYPPPTSSAL